MAAFCFYFIFILLQWKCFHFNSVLTQEQQRCDYKVAFYRLCLSLTVTNAVWHPFQIDLREVSGRKAERDKKWPVILFAMLVLIQMLRCFVAPFIEAVSSFVLTNMLFWLLFMYFKTE